MNTEERRSRILYLLKHSQKATSASTLAKHFSVSRQIIVGDIALLRAQGNHIQATPRGYMLDISKNPSTLRTIACKHDSTLTETELNICIDNGCKVLNVIVEHPLYGQLTGELQLSSRYEIRQFMDKLKSNKIHSLCELTNDIHLHTLDCPDEETYQRICRELSAQGILMETPSD